MKSKWSGKCPGMRTDQGSIIHDWPEGAEIFYQKEPKCICINEECFKKQKEQAQQPAANPAQIPSSASLPPRSESERTDDCSHMIEILWEMAEKKANKIVHFDDKVKYPDDYIRQKLILAEVLFKGLVETWNRD